MRWGVELWDGFDKVSKYFRDGIEFYEKYDEFLKERCIIENTYAKNLRDLVKKYELNVINNTNKRTKSIGLININKQNKDDSDECKFTYLQCFSRSLSELKDIAGQHELIAENTYKKVIEKLGQLIKSFKDDRRKLIETRDFNYSIHQSKDDLLKKSKQKYETSFKELEKAKEILGKVEADDSSSRNDIKKHQTIVDSKLTYCDSCKAEYAKQLLEANQIKNKYYSEQLPQALNSFQILEEKRIKLFQDFINECVNIEKEVLPRIERCYKEIEDASNQISIEKDIDIVVNIFKTGYSIPVDHIFEDLSDNNQLNNHKSTSLNSNGGTIGPNSNKRDNKYRTIHRIKGLFGSKNEGDPIYDLPPQQQKKELLKRIETINSDIAKEEKEKEGLLKLKEIYQMNQKFGDSQSALQALKQNEEKLNNLRSQLKKYQEYFQEFERNGNLQRPCAKTPTSQHKQYMKNSSSQSSLNNTSKTSIPGTPVSQHSSNIVNTGTTTIYTSNFRQKLSPSESFDDDHDEIDSLAQRSIDNYDDEFDQVIKTYANEPKRVTQQPQLQQQEATYEHIDRTSDSHSDDNFIGEAIVLYSFEGTVQNALSINEREMLKILERDSGDGWTLAKNLHGDKGYVPTGYIQITYF